MCGIGIYIGQNLDEWRTGMFYKCNSIPPYNSPPLFLSLVSGA